MGAVYNIRTEEVRNCHVCGQRGEPLYEGISDLNNKAPGEWNLVRCFMCGLVWVNPRPIESEISKLYREYYTHEIDPHPSITSPLWKKIKLAVRANAFGYDNLNNLIDDGIGKWVGRALNSVPFLKSMVGVEIMYLNSQEKGKLLDIGCGNGRFLKLMSRLGWDVMGVEPDERAADVARRQIGGNVFTGSLEGTSFQAHSFDVITMNQIIEHVYSPSSLLKEAYRVLRPGGKLVIMTPNIESLGHRIFKKYWVSLEPPRHVHLFSLRGLKECLENTNFQLRLLRSTSFFAHRAWTISKSLKNSKRFSPDILSVRDKIEGFGFQASEEIIRLFNECAGEEIFLIAAKEE